MFFLDFHRQEKNLCNQKTEWCCRDPRWIKSATSAIGMELQESPLKQVPRLALFCPQLLSTQRVPWLLISTERDQWLTYTERDQWLTYEDVDQRYDFYNVSWATSIERGAVAWLFRWLLCDDNKEQAKEYNKNNNKTSDGSVACRTWHELVE